MAGGLLRKRDAARLERESANRMKANETDEATDARVPLQRQRALVHAHSSDTKSEVRARVWKPSSFGLRSTCCGHCLAGKGQHINDKKLNPWLRFMTHGGDAPLSGRLRRSGRVWCRKVVLAPQMQMFFAR